MVERAALIKEIETLPPRYYGEVIDFVGYIKDKKVKKSLSLEKAAEMAAEEYHNNKELTAFGCLHQFANPEKISDEKGAWERAVIEKYAKN